MYVIPLVLFMVGKGRGYYLGGVYPMLWAMGAVLGERWVASMSKVPRRAVQTVFFAGLAVYGLLFSLILFPFATSGRLEDVRPEEQRRSAGRDRVGRASEDRSRDIRDSLPPEQRGSVGVIVGNYGEAGAIEILGPAYGLPLPISRTNSAWLRGYPEPQPTTLIVVGWSREEMQAFSSCRLAGHNGNSLGVKNEESEDHPDIYVCGGPIKPWPEFWKEHQAFG